MKACGALLLSLAAACTSAWNDPDRLTYTAAETVHALAPLRQLERRCYDDSSSKLAQRPVKLEFVLYIDAQGLVHSAPREGYPADPALLECLRTGLNELRFPAKGEADQVRIGLELKS
jgi:hypothetical protein